MNSLNQIKQCRCCLQSETTKEQNIHIRSACSIQKYLVQTAVSPAVPSDEPQTHILHPERCQLIWLSLSPPENINPGDKTHITLGSPAPFTPEGVLWYSHYSQHVECELYKVTSLFVIGDLPKHFAFVEQLELVNATVEKKQTNKTGPGTVCMVCFSSTGAWVWRCVEGCMSLSLHVCVIVYICLASHLHP